MNNETKVGISPDTPVEGVTFTGNPPGFRMVDELAAKVGAPDYSTEGGNNEVIIQGQSGKWYSFPELLYHVLEYMDRRLP